jgi:hypothetical protein
MKTTVRAEVGLESGEKTSYFFKQLGDLAVLTLDPVSPETDIEQLGKRMRLVEVLIDRLLLPIGYSWGRLGQGQESPGSGFHSDRSAAPEGNLLPRVSEEQDGICLFLLQPYRGTEEELP